ncbi:MAG TPA: quinone-dependent dihydroorotate dehydrogenase [Hyphomicrobiaceae bacterium]|nr:quinone-dependent dihydroorotate dehydrogenase [Hyphomicrobiaceae bacterium]
MLSTIFNLAKPMLFALDPETAHEATLKSLEAGLYPRFSGPDDSRLNVKAFGLTFPNPIGMAAGFDKDARVPDAVLGMGLGFAEIGTVTPLPQAGNPKPRQFRLVAERAVINRNGFNNHGHKAAFERLSRRPRQGIVGINVGANKDSRDRTADYVAGAEMFYDLASYLTINISSPNTPGLRDLQAPAALDELLGRVMAVRAARIAAGERHVPMVVKIAPDIAEDDLPAIVERIVAHGVDAIAVSNTTLARPGLEKLAVAKEAGGLSGAPLFSRSTAMLARVYQLVGRRLPLIGIGGIGKPEQALAKIEAGASVIQLYTGLVFGGPELIGQIKTHLVQHCRDKGLRSIGEATGSAAEAWARRPLDA